MAALGVGRLPVVSDADPHELHDLQADEPAVYQRLRDELVRWIAEERRLREGLPSSETRVLSEESVERLRALGYVE